GPAGGVDDHGSDLVAWPPGCENVVAPVGAYIALICIPVRPMGGILDPRVSGHRNLLDARQVHSRLLTGKGATFQLPQGVGTWPRVRQRPYAQSALSRKMDGIDGCRGKIRIGMRIR